LAPPLSWFVEDVGHPALAAVLTVEVRGHEDSGPTFTVVALPPEASDLPVLVNLVVATDSQLDLLLLVLVFLRGRVILFLPLLGSTSQSEVHEHGRLLLDVVIGESPAILQLLPGEIKRLNHVKRSRCRSS